MQAPALLLATIQGLYQGQDRGATIEVECRRPLGPAEHAISTCISLARSSEEALMPITLPHGATCAELHLEAPPAETSTSSCLLPQVALLHASPLNVNDFCLFFGGAISVRPVHVRKGLTPLRRQGISSSSTSRSNKLASRTGLAWTSTSTPPAPTAAAAACSWPSAAVGDGGGTKPAAAPASDARASSASTLNSTDAVDRRRGRAPRPQRLRALPRLRPVAPRLGQR